MAEFTLLLRLRFRLFCRQWQISKVAAIAVLLVLVGLGVTVWLVTSTLVSLHAGLSASASERLTRLTAVLLSALFVIGPLVGMRSQEYLDVTKLFVYPVRPTTVFTTTVLGGLFGISTVFVVPLLLLPPVAAQPQRVLGLLGLTFVYVVMLHAVVQCVTLAFLGALTSRRFRDFTAILAPAIGLTCYTAMQGLVLSTRHGTAPTALLRLLETDALAFLDDVAVVLPPVWFADACTGSLGLEVALMSLLALTLGLVVLGAFLTTRAFHGVTDLGDGSEAEAQPRTARPGVIVRRLPHALAALYEKERLVRTRDPWMRMLIVQQIGFVALITIFEAWIGRRDFAAPTIPIWLLLYFEAGFLQNMLGLEGAAFRSSAALPVAGSTLLLGKNLVWFRAFGLGNLVMVPSLALLGAWLGRRSFDVEAIVVLTVTSCIVLPAMLGTANVISVLLPLRVPQRSRRALGQDQSQGGGCTTPIVRIFASLAALAPAAGVAILVTRPWTRRPSIDVEWLAFFVPIALALALGTWFGLTRLAGHLLDARRERLCEYLR